VAGTQIFRAIAYIYYFSFVSAVAKGDIISKNSGECISKTGTEHGMIGRKIRMRWCGDIRLPPGEWIGGGLNYPANKLNGSFCIVNKLCFKRSNSGIKKADACFGKGKGLYIKRRI